MSENETPQSDNGSQDEEEIVAQQPEAEPEPELEPEQPRRREKLPRRKPKGRRNPFVVLLSGVFSLLFLAVLISGGALRQVDEGCFELIETGELITAAPDAGRDASDRENAPLCHYEELARQENRMWEARRKASLPDDHTDQAASNSSAGPKNS